jgi:general secretion pathway protein J
MRRQASQQGFTLIELLVALAIFSIMSLMAYQGMQSVFTTRAHTDDEAKRLQAVQMAFLYLQRDLGFISAREIRDEYGDSQSAFKLAEQGVMRLELTRAGHRNPAQLPRSSLQRVAYSLDDNKLHRLYWRVLDRAPDSQAVDRELLDNVESLEIRVLDERDEWQQYWPTSGSSRILPRAIEVTLTLKDWGPLTRLFMLPEVD